MTSNTYRARHRHSLVVRVLDDRVDLRRCQMRPVRAVLYQRLDQPEPVTVRALAEFRELFEVFSGPLSRSQSGP